jgi:hypothetical protein
MAIVEVKPIERQRWHGKTGKDSFSRPVSISTPVSVITGQYATGLTEEDRERLEKITGYDLSPEYNVGKPHSFWGQAVSKVKLEDKTNIFNTDLPINEIKVKNETQNKEIRPKTSEKNSSNNPQKKVVFTEKDEKSNRKNRESNVSNELNQSVSYQTKNSESTSSKNRSYNSKNKAGIYSKSKIKLSKKQNQKTEMRYQVQVVRPWKWN